MAPNPETTQPATPTPEESGDIITREFLENALQKEANGGPVPKILSHTTTLGTKPGDNYMSIIYSVDIQLDNGTTRHLIVKCYPNHPGRQELTNKSNMFFKECEVYSKWIPELKRFQTEVLGLTFDQVIKLPYANFVHGQCIDFESPEGEARKGQLIKSLDNYIFMEDIRKTYGFRMASRHDSLDIHHMRLVYEALAKTHSLSWVYRHHVESNIKEKFPCFVINFAEEDMALFAHILNANLDQAKTIFDKEFGPGNNYSEGVENFRKVLPDVEKFFMGKGDGADLEKFLRIPIPDPVKFGKDAENPEPWTIICHGDCWSNNLLFRYDKETGKPVEVILVDLQMPQETCVINDLEYVMYACTGLDLRRAHTDELLQLYHDTFNRVCELTKTPTLPGFNMDSLRFRFHRGKFLGYYMASFGLPIMLKEADKAVNLDDMAEGKDFTDAMAELCQDSGSNDIFTKRLIGVTQSMIEDGIF